MNTKTTLIIVAIIAVGLAGINSYLTLDKTTEINDGLTGYTGSEGYVNITIATVISVNFSTDAISWGAGSIDGGSQNATLETSGPSVTRGNWSTDGISGLVIENIGNINASLTLASGKNVTELLGGSEAHHAYLWNLTNSESGSCNPTEFSNATYAAVNKTGYAFCNQFGFLDAQDEITLDIQLTVPYDGNAGALTDTITATASTAL